MFQAVIFSDVTVSPGKVGIISLISSTNSKWNEYFDNFFKKTSSMQIPVVLALSRRDAECETKTVITVYR